MEEMSALLDKWTAEEGLSWKFAHWTSPLQKHHITSTDPKKNPWWGAFVEAAAGIGLDLEPEIFPAATDSRFLREMGIRALGFSPMVRRPVYKIVRLCFDSSKPHSKKKHSSFPGGRMWCDLGQLPDSIT